MPKLFGTDGIRGRVDLFPLDRDSAFKLGRSLAGLLRSRGLEPRVLLGRDTRESGPRLELALAAGLASAGAEAISAGIVPTPAVSFLVRRRRFGAGIAISASHNPFQDNGLKVLSPEGMKIPEDWEEELEGGIQEEGETARGAGAGPVAIEPGLAEEYLDFLRERSTFPSAARPLRLVLDCANGAAFELGPRLFRDLGFRVETVGCSPDGRNINQGCGSQHPELLARKVLELQADLGIALDGDADRAVWADEKGRVLNGDHTLFIQGRRLKEKGRLGGDVVVATSMSNMGLEKALARMGVRLERTRVGDKYVLERMTELGASLGGERSGHTIFLEDGPAGDGLLAGLRMVEALAERGAALSELAEGLVEFPQKLVNVPVARKPAFDSVPEVRAVLEEIRTELEGRGRLDIRYSGTESLARVMVEADDAALVERCARRAAEAIARNMGTS